MKSYEHFSPTISSLEEYFQNEHSFPSRDADAFIHNATLDGSFSALTLSKFYDSNAFNIHLMDRISFQILKIALTRC